MVFFLQPKLLESGDWVEAKINILVKGKGKKELSLIIVEKHLEMSKSFKVEKVLK